VIGIEVIVVRLALTGTLGKRARGVVGWGEGTSGIMYVGEAAGEEEGKLK
jgi:hypothetical protein